MTSCGNQGKSPGHQGSCSQASACPAAPATNFLPVPFKLLSLRVAGVSFSVKTSYDKELSWVYSDEEFNSGLINWNVGEREREREASGKVTEITVHT